MERYIFDGDKIRLRIDALSECKICLDGYKVLQYRKGDYVLVKENMSQLKVEKMNILSAGFHGESSLPPIAVKLNLSDISNNFYLDEDDGLFINYGTEESVFPYRYQDMYDRELTPTDYETVVLENDYLKATFVPAFGGKLWSLYDKTAGRELLFQNSVVRPCNLAVRNAWLSGGIEWNSCFKGHSPFTCSLIHTAKTYLSDGTPVLRFYYFERIRLAIVQMDCFLPSDSKLLYVRTRITNPNDEVIPMYWWSNVGAVQKQGDRVIMPANESYTVNPNAEVIKISIPEHNGIDVTYPYDIVTSSDFFWKTEKNTRRYIAQLDKDGYGLCQTSTSLLKGRKLFVWGNSQGGEKWMNFLTADGESGAYDEIQCGLAHTQYECIPMPPHTVWEWLEGYGAMQAEKEKVHGEWSEARAEVEAQFDERIRVEDLEKLLDDTREMAKMKAKEMIFAMQDGWGALELLRRQKSGKDLMCSHLDFGECTPTQSVWLKLLSEGTVGLHDGEEIPASYMRQKEWLTLLKKAIQNKDRENWYAYYLLGCAYVADEEYDLAENYLKKSVSLNATAWNNYALGICYKKIGEKAKACEYVVKAYNLRKGDLSLAKELYRTLFENDESEQILSFFEKECAEIKNNKRCLLYYAYALARIGEIEKAEEILCGKDGKTYMVVPDIRESELTETELWFYLQERKGKSKEEVGEPPRDLDFRMFTKREDWI